MLQLHPDRSQTRKGEALSHHPKSGSLNISALLGPTNTGKTWFAMERLKAHPDGMIGFPLRLLARENYEKLVKAKGVGQVALITGEEKIVPPHAKWFSCTVEAMPQGLKTSFVAIDEIQLCADPDRGHVFTDRLLHMRGTSETMFLGADTMRPILKALFKDIVIEMRPRLSALSYTGHIPLAKLPPRSAVVAFSVNDVYAIADLLRRRRGGCAIVMGQLSPRTRNAQVALFQNREVDYLVATDAIGMGLNMDVDHVALAARDKFDGDHYRALTPSELAQIFGRAGRGLRDGTFGTTGDARPLDTNLIQEIESHHFRPLEKIFWRQSELDYRTPRTLLNSLQTAPPYQITRRGREANDVVTLQRLMQSNDVMSRADSAQSVRLLWEICQIPDFNKLGDSSHGQLCEKLFVDLSMSGHVAEGWFSSQIARLGKTEGDIETLMHRLTAIRTCAYVASKKSWYPDKEPWDRRTLDVENALSDALHEKLRAKYIDERASSLSRHLKNTEKTDALSAISENGQLIVEGYQVGKLSGLQLELDPTLTPSARDLAIKAGRRALLQKFPAQVRKIEASADDDFSIDTLERSICWQGQKLADIRPGPLPLQPVVRLVPGQLEDSYLRSRLEARIADYMHRHIRTRLTPLFEVIESLDGKAGDRALSYALQEHCGIIPREVFSASVGLRSTEQFDRPEITFGQKAIFLPAVLRPFSGALRHMLMSLAFGWDITPPPFHKVSFPVFARDTETPVSSGFLLSRGYKVRLDIAEKWIRQLSARTARRDAVSPLGLSASLGIKANDLPRVLRSWGFQCRVAQPMPPEIAGPPAPLMILATARKKSLTPRAKVKHVMRDRHDPDAPFAALKGWKRM